MNGTSFETIRKADGPIRLIATHGQTLKIARCPISNAKEECAKDLGVCKPPKELPYEILTPERVPLESLDSLPEDEVREACFQYASESCYGTAFVREAKIAEISSTHAYHYLLETFTEKREIVLREEPYRGQEIDGPDKGSPPSPWNIMVSIPTLFQDSQMKIEVPHTAFVRSCRRCGGSRYVQCSSCGGSGHISCGFCGSTGMTFSEICTYCYGSGSIGCGGCSRTGSRPCYGCSGQGSLKHFKMLIVTWKNHVDCFVSDTGHFSQKRILEVSGKVIVTEQRARVVPINHCTNPTVNDVSRNLVVQHQKAFPSEMIRMQRQVLRGIPFRKYNYSWKNKRGEFYVCGLENRVYFEWYPQQCCFCTCL